MRQPVRVVFDSEARLPLDSQLVASIDQAPLLVVAARRRPRRGSGADGGAGASWSARRPADAFSPGSPSSAGGR